MELGFAVPQSGSWATPDRVVRLTRRAEELGYRSAWTFQRLLFPAQPAIPRWIETYRSVLDPLVTLSYVAAQTSRIRLGVAVLNLPFASPALVAKQAGTLDVLSGGRVELGFGLGWAPEEYQAVGASFAGRGRRAEEYLRMLTSLWTEDVSDLRGEFYDLPAVRMDPKPVQRPHPPILLGGASEAALRRAGRLADGWVAGSAADLRSIGESISVVAAAAVEAGRDPKALRYVCRGVVRLGTETAGDAGGAGRAPLSGTLEQIRGDLAEAADQGVTELFIDLNFDPRVGSPDADPEVSERSAEEILTALAPAGT